MKINTREVAERLYRLAKLEQAAWLTAEAMGDDDRLGLLRRATETRDLANAFYEAKTEIEL